MGLLTATRNADERKTESAERDANPERRWEYKARNLNKVAGMALEDDFNKFGQKGWEFVAVADGYAIFKREL